MRGWSLLSASRGICIRAFAVPVGTADASTRWRIEPPIRAFETVDAATGSERGHRRLYDRPDVRQ